MVSSKPFIFLCRFEIDFEEFGKNSHCLIGNDYVQFYVNMYNPFEILSTF